MKDRNKYRGRELRQTHTDTDRHRQTQTEQADLL